MSAIRSLGMSFALLLGVALAQEEGEDTAAATLAELAEKADLVALVQVADTDYEYTREFPSGGTAFLRVLIPYKLDRALEEDIIEVYEEGLHPNECYFVTPSVIEEGRRHLVFLRTHPQVDKQYVGLDQGCALDVLVTEDNRYALRYPPAGIELGDDLANLAKPMEFQDAYAFETDETLRVQERNALLAAGMLEEVDGRYRYTHGIPLSEVRQRMGEDALTLDRSLRRFEP